MRRKLLAVLIILVVSLAGVSFSNEERSEGGEEKMISFSVERSKNVYLLGESMPVEINFRNNTKYPIKFTKPVPIEEKFLFAIKLDEKELAKISDEKIKRKHMFPTAIRTLIDPYPESLITLNPGEEYKTEINIAEMVKELELKPGTYKVRLIYTMWICILKEKIEYAENAKGKTREWESNEIEITLK